MYRALGWGGRDTHRAYSSPRAAVGGGAVEFRVSLLTVALVVSHTGFAGREGVVEMNVTMNIFIICISPPHHITITAGPCRAVAWWSTVESLSWCSEAPFAGGSTLYAISDQNAPTLSRYR